MRTSRSVRRRSSLFCVSRRRAPRRRRCAASLGVSQQTFYRWKAKYSGMNISDAQKLKGLEDENRRLKRLLAESMLDLSALKDLLAKN